MFEGQTVLVTGGAGSVGRNVVSSVLDSDLDQLRIFDNNEPNLASLRHELDDDRCRFLAGDVRERDRLERAFQGVDVVVHLAAMKHVDISEYNPFEAVKTNVLGLQNVVDVAIDVDVERLVFASSDKAVNPANTMGTTKLLGEKLITAGNKYSGQSDLRLASVRFGNVINSSWSVVPLFERQIRDGGPITVTDERMTRFFLTYDDITDVVTEAIATMNGGEVFVPKMPALRIETLAEVMRETLAPEYGLDPSNVDIEKIGRRPGETLHEEIMTEREAARALENDHMYAIPPEDHAGFLTYDALDGFDDSESVVRSSANADKLDVDAVADLLSDGGVVSDDG